MCLCQHSSSDQCIEMGWFQHADKFAQSSKIKTNHLARDLSTNAATTSPFTGSVQTCVQYLQRRLVRRKPSMGSPPQFSYRESNVPFDLNRQLSGSTQTLQWNLSHDLCLRAVSGVSYRYMDIVVTTYDTSSVHQGRHSKPICLRYCIGSGRTVKVFSRIWLFRYI